MNKFSLQFDEASFYLDYCKTLKFVVNAVADEVVRELNSKPFSFATNTFRKELVEYGENLIIAQVGTSHWYAFIVNYGSGSKMVDKQQAEQFAEEWGYEFNPTRRENDMAISSWPEGEHKIPNWELGDGFTTIEGSGTGGTNLEEKYKDNPMFQPVEPHDFMGEAMRSAKEYLVRRLKIAMQAFPYSMYLKGGGDH